jgi:histidinol-phosphate phosphatase family protein
MFESNTPALFLDRDGVVNQRIVGGYVTHPAEFVLIPEIVPVVQWAHAHQIPAIVITNQQGVGKGLMSYAQLEQVHDHMRRLIPIHAVYSAVELQGQPPNRRKPLPAMLFEAAADHQINLASSLFVGDSITDVEAGNRAGCPTALVCTSTMPLDNTPIHPTYTCNHELLLSVVQRHFSEV